MVKWLGAIENFIMSPTWDSSLASVATLSYPYRWSICSLGFLFTRMKESFTTNNLNCLKVDSFTDTQYTNNRNFPDLGQDFNLTAQCQIALGDTSTFCGTQQESLCLERALCTNTFNGLACDVTIHVLDKPLVIPRELLTQIRPLPWCRIDMRSKRPLYQGSGAIRLPM